MKELTFEAAQSDMRRGYLCGAPGVLSSGLVWLTAGVVAAIALIPIAGFFTTGTSADIPLGAGVKGFVDEDVPLSFAASAPAPLQIAPAAEPLKVPGATAAESTPESAAPAAVAATQ